MAWITPKTDWTTADGVDFNGLNRIEGDIKFIADNPVGTLLRLGGGVRNVAIGGVAVDSGPSLVVADGVGSLPTLSGNTVALFQNNDSPTVASILTIVSGETGSAYLYFGDKDNQNSGQMYYSNTIEAFTWYTDSSFAMRLTDTNHLLLNTPSDPGETLHIGSGGMRVTGTTHPFIIKSTGFLDDTWYDGTIYTDTIAEKTASAGISFNNVVKVDTLEENTASAGVTISDHVYFTQTPAYTLQALTTSNTTLPKGLLQIHHDQGSFVGDPSFSIIEELINGLWLGISNGASDGRGGTAGDLLWSTGSNLRARMTTGTGSIRWNKY